MFNLHLHLDYHNQLRIESKDHYRYDFVKFNYLDPEIYIAGFDRFLNDRVFVFRTIQKGEGKGNILIDILEDENINGVKVAYHKNCHFHFLDEEEFANEKKKQITEFIEIAIHESEISKQYVAILKDQLCYSNNHREERFKFPEIKYLLFTEYKSEKNINNTDRIEFAPVFRKQLSAKWHRNRWKDFNSTTNIDTKEIEDEDTWTIVKEKMERNREGWHIELQKAEEELRRESRSFEFLPIEKY